MSAIFMHKETFALSYGGCGTLTVSKNGKEYICDTRENFIEVDELIAIPVQMLNRKGYKTACCCAGHAPGHLFPYITFDKEHDFPFLPEGFTQRKNIISKEYQKTEDTEWQILLAIMESAKALHDWAEALPPIEQ